MNSINKRELNRHKIDLRKYGSLPVLLIIVVVLSIASPKFLTAGILKNIAISVSIIGIVAAGETFVILSGGIDLSVGSTVGLVGIVTAAAMADFQMNPALAIFLGMGTGILFGLANGALVAKVKIPPFIATLGTMQIIRGIAVLYSEGSTVRGIDEGFISIVTGNVLGIPNLFIAMILVYVVAWFILEQTKTGRYISSIGGNEVATRLSGVNINKYKIYTYLISSILAGVAGILLTGRLSSASATNGEGMELDAIAGVVIGGTSLSGGIGSIQGTFIGILIVQIIKSSLTLLSVSPYWNKVVIGIVIICAVFIDVIRKGRSTLNQVN